MTRVLLITALLLAFPAVVVGQEPSADVVEAVQKHFETGAAFYFEQKYDEAIKEFQSGYSLYPDPIFLYNISMAHGKMGRVDQSLAMAELAQSSGLGEPDATQNVARIVALRETKVARDVATNMRVSLSAQTSKSAASKDVDWWFWGGVATAGVGVGSVVIATVVDAGLSDTIDAYEAAAASGEVETYNRLKASIESDQNTALAFYVVGGVLVAGGAGLVTWSYLRNDSSEVMLVPTTNGAAVVGSW
ncbi:MAG: hypothetical protein R3E66_24295 [bacterium]